MIVLSVLGCMLVMAMKGVAMARRAGDWRRVSGRVLKVGGQSGSVQTGLVGGVSVDVGGWLSASWEQRIR